MCTITIVDYRYCVHGRLEIGLCPLAGLRLRLGVVRIVQFLLKSTFRKHEEEGTDTGAIEAAKKCTAWNGKIDRGVDDRCDDDPTKVREGRCNLAYKEGDITFQRLVYSLDYSGKMTSQHEMDPKNGESGMHWFDKEVYLGEWEWRIDTRDGNHRWLRLEDTYWFLLYGPDGRVAGQAV